MVYHGSRHILELLHMVYKFRGYKHATQSAYTDSDSTNEMPKAENTDAFTPSINSSGLQHSSLMLGSATQRPPLNYFDLSQISQQVVLLLGSNWIASLNLSKHVPGTTK